VALGGFLTSVSVALVASSIACVSAIGQTSEQLVCTAAVNDSTLWPYHAPGALMYRTDNPALMSEQLERIARYKDLFKGSDNPRVTRYAVAVWPATDKKLGERVYWVGVQVYLSAWWEFIEDNLTDSRSKQG
jgi:hypothetical protein